MSEQQTVYVISRGYYSDRRVVAVFSTEDAAKQFCAIRNHPRQHDWERYHYDSHPFDPLDRIAAGRIRHVIDFDPTGAVERVKSIDDAWDVLDPPPELVRVTARTVSGKQWLRVWVEARDPEHAVKIAAEKRAEYLAAQAGIA